MAGGPSDDVAQRFALNIRRDVADAVNQRWNAENTNVTDPVNPGHWDPSSGPLSLEFNDPQSTQLTEDEKSQIRSMCREEVKKRIVLDDRDLAGLIVGHARVGQNFFDYFR